MIGRFVGPATGGFESFRYFPLLDHDGKLVSIRLDGIETLRLTANGFGDVSHLLLYPVGPASSEIPDQSILEDSSVTINFEIASTFPIADVTVLSSNPALIPAENVVISGTGTDRTITVTPLPDAFGAGDIMPTVTDAIGGTVSVSFTVNVTAVNDPPSFSVPKKVVIAEDQPTTVEGFISDASPGPGEFGDINFDGIVNSQDLVSAFEMFETGAATVVPVADANGTGTVTVVATDTGGTENGGVNRTEETVQIVVLAVNDPPRYDEFLIDGKPVTSGDSISIDEKSSPVEVRIRQIEPGPPNEQHQEITVAIDHNNTQLIQHVEAGPSSPEGDRSYWIFLNADQSGNADFTFTVRDDGGTENGGEDTKATTFTLQVARDLPGVYTSEKVVFEGGVHMLTLKLTKPSPLPVSVDVLTLDSPDPSNPEFATPDVDFTPFRTTVVFPPGIVQMQVPLSIEGDDVGEGTPFSFAREVSVSDPFPTFSVETLSICSERVFVRLENAQNAMVYLPAELFIFDFGSKTPAPGGFSDATIHIRDDDHPSESDCIASFRQTLIGPVFVPQAELPLKFEIDGVPFSTVPGEETVRNIRIGLGGVSGTGSPQIQLRSPAGGVVPLIQLPPERAVEFPAPTDLNFNDRAGAPPFTGEPPIQSGTFSSHNFGLPDLLDSNPNGTWQFFISDQSQSGTLQIGEIWLQFEAGKQNFPPAIADISRQEATAGVYHTIWFDVMDTDDPKSTLTVTAVPSDPAVGGSGTIVFDEATGRHVFTFKPLREGMVTWTLRVEDPSGAWAETAFECVVENPRVPFIEGVTLAEAKDHIIAGGLMVGTVTEVYDETFPTGTVLDANPEPGTPVEPGSPVGLLVSKGPRPLVDLVVTKVGPIQARPGDEVSYTIAVMNRGTVDATLIDVHDTMDSGTSFVSASPPCSVEGIDVTWQLQNKVLHPGETLTFQITVKISPEVQTADVINVAGVLPVEGFAGTPPIDGATTRILSTIPELTGKTRTVAETLIADAHFTVGDVAQEHSDAVPAGQVISQTHEPNTEAPRGTKIGLTISLGPEPPPTVVKITDPNTRFFRIYVRGPALDDGLRDIFDERAGFEKELQEIQTQLETSLNQRFDSTSKLFVEPRVDDLRTFFAFVKSQAMPGDEVTFYFKGHGSNESKRDANKDEPQDGFEGGPYDDTLFLNPGGDLSDDQLADMLQGFRPGVTICLILDGCNALLFTDGANDIKESDSIKVIASPDAVPVAFRAPFEWSRTTLSEDIVDGLWLGTADANDDDIITADELKDYLRSRMIFPGVPRWRIDLPDPPVSRVTMDGDVSLGSAEHGRPDYLPTVTGSISGPLRPVGQSFVGTVQVQGRSFTPGVLARVEWINADRTTFDLGNLVTRDDGTFSFVTEVNLDHTLGNLILAQAIDAEGFHDATLVQVPWLPGQAVNAPCGDLELELLAANDVDCYVLDRDCRLDVSLVDHGLIGGDATLVGADGALLFSLTLGVGSYEILDSSLVLAVIEGFAAIFYEVGGTLHEVTVTDGGIVELAGVTDEAGTLVAVEVAVSGVPGAVTINGFAIPREGTMLVKSVAIDIKPGSQENVINLRSKGTLPVAILSAADFDATTIDPLSVTLAGALVNVRKNGTPHAGIEDANADGLADLVLHVQTSELGLDANDTEVVLTGKTYDGIVFVRGTGSVLLR